MRGRRRKMRRLVGMRSTESGTTRSVVQRKASELSPKR